ncbi:MAG TPA: hypothetical protein VMT35_06245 [Ignavibacteriaceae bacterium]|nr:hypothetical protein [Ignavibacteriaceae bacterium]
MQNAISPMKKFDFLIGDWKLEYKVPNSSFSAEDSGAGEGNFQRILNNKYVTFNYYAKLSVREATAHAVFAWDEKTQIYRYWWFEDSGSFMSASCNFINENTLCLNWHDSLLVQTFKKINENKLILQMKSPKNENEYELILEVVLQKK